ncbi:MAG: fibronectin type III domain-containing protein, partial [Oscillospiraceae bacterium]
MFKKRLKGLLAMLLAGSIAATALPLTASATIDGDITIHNLSGGSSTISPDGAVVIGDDGNYKFSDEALNNSDIAGNLNAFNLWVICGENYLNTPFLQTVYGDGFAYLIYNDHDGWGNYHSYKAKPYHTVAITTKDLSVDTVTNEDLKNFTVNNFPFELRDTVDLRPMMDESSTTWTAWFKGDSELNSTGCNYNSGNCIQTVSEPQPITTRLSADIVKIGYDSVTDSDDYLSSYYSGKTIIQIDVKYKTFDIPVRNALLQPETEADGSIKTLTVRKDNEDWLDTKDDSFYLCYVDKEQKFFKISSSEMKTEKAVWDEIAAWVTENEYLDESKLVLCRDVMAYVTGNGTYDKQFDTKDLIDYQIINQGQTTNEALIALYTADAKSIWRVVPYYTGVTSSFFTYQANAMKSISDFLLEYPHENLLFLTEQDSINVTAVDPNANEEIDDNSYIVSNLLDEEGEPRTITDHCNDLLDAFPPEAGKKYDADGWQLWGAGVECGGICDFSQIELEEKSDSIGLTELNYVKKDKVLVYFPQVDIAPSLEVTAPVAGEAPSFECTIKDTVGGYSVEKVEWSCGNTTLSENDIFEAGKQYRVDIQLLADPNLSFVDTTPVTINGEKAEAIYNENVGFNAFQYFATAPEKPANVKATAGDGKVTLTWDIAEGAARYRVYIYTNGDLSSNPVMTGTTDNTCTIENLVNGTKYGFIVTAISDAGLESSYTTEDVVYETPVEPKPALPANVKAVPGNGKVTLTWDAVDGVAGYAVYVFSGDGSELIDFQTTQETSITIENLTNGTTYAFIVVSVTASGLKSEYTPDDAVYATPFAPAPEKPANVKAVAGDGEVTLTWDAVEGATQYVIKDGGSTVLANDIKDTTYTFTGLENGTTYTYTVFAYANGKWSTASDKVTATPKASYIPKNVKATAGDG